MKQEKTKAVVWENELQALKNALESLNLKGYEVWPNHNGFRSKTTFLLRDDEGNSLTGSWTYSNLNHFIMGYGKAFNKKNKPAAPTTVDSKQGDVEGFTPIEWEAKKITSTQIIIGIKGYGEGDNYRKDNRCGQIAIIKGWNGDSTAPLSEEDKANARLIASAPTLLKENGELKEQVKILREALNPFFSLAQEVLDIKEHDQIVYEFNGAKITTQDLKTVLTTMYNTEALNQTK